MQALVNFSENDKMLACIVVRTIIKLNENAQRDISVLRASVIIPTFNRPVELKNCIQSILEQTVRPFELIIIDDGNLQDLPLKKECKDAGIQYRYLKKNKPGLTASRNAGVKLAQGDIIFFLDDDVVLFPDYIQEMLNTYDEKRIIGGVGGLIANQKPSKFIHPVRRLLDVALLISSFSEGKVLPSGFCINFGETGLPIKRVKEVDFLSGGVSSYRKEIFEEFSFDTEKYLGYGLGEDMDFSYQVSKKYKLMLNPKVRLFHLKSSKMRLDKKEEGRQFIINRYLFFTRHVKKSWWSWLFFFYAIFGYVLIRIISFIILPKTKKIGRIKGYFSAFGDILKGNIRIQN